MTPPDPSDGSGKAGAGPEQRTVTYPGGLTARYRWVGTGGQATSDGIRVEAGLLADHADLVSKEGERMCAADLRLEGPGGAWAVRFASPIHDEPQGVFWDTARLLLVKYGFVVYALVARTGELIWHHVTRTPMLALLASPRLPHVIAQSELETFALDQDGQVGWRIAHSDVVTDARLIAGRLVLDMYGGSILGLDPHTGSAL